MSSSQVPSEAPEPDAESDSDLVDRIRRTALGAQADRNSQRSAQLAFDPSLDLDTRMRMIAKLSALDPPSRRSQKRRWGSWMHVPVGILFVFALGAGLTRRVAPPKSVDEDEVVAQQDQLESSGAPTEKSDDERRAEALDGTDRKSLEGTKSDYSDDPMH